MGRARRLLTAAAALSVVLTLAGCAADSPDQQLTSGMKTFGDDDGMNGAVLDEPYVVPDTTLTATDDAPFSLTADTTEPLTLVFFGYTHCPDICQLVMSDIASAMTRLDQADRDKVAMLFITSDPARDDPQVLRDYLDRFDPGFEGLTGDLDTIVTVADDLGVPIEKGARMPSGGYEVAHGTQIVGVDDRDRAPIVWTEGTSAADLAEDITTLLHDNG
ncbi:MAG TPA: SCO family protein [Nocardioidaceae bacterium]|nr:SCO family protein [Nocardioidaceae bacterium]